VAGAPRDVAVRLELNEWNGTVEPRLVLRALCETRTGELGVLDDALGLSERIALQETRGESGSAPPHVGARSLCDRRGEGVAGVIGDLLVSGDDVLIACGDPGRWRHGLESTLGGLARGRADVASWDLLAMLPTVAEPYAHVFALDPPLADDAAGFLSGLPGAGFAHSGWGPPEQAIGDAALQSRLDFRGTVARVYRLLRDAAPIAADALDSLSEGWSPWDTAAAVRVLAELSLLELDGDAIRLLGAQRTELERSPAYRGHLALLEGAAAGLAPRPARAAA
jgi:single-stranded-DNA-specific exonuclease